MDELLEASSWIRCSLRLRTSLQGEDAAAHAGVIAHAIDGTAARMRPGGLGKTLVAIWFDAAVSAARHRIEQRPAFARSDTAH